MNEPTCVDCGQELTLVRPGKHQCDNPNCVQNDSKPESVPSCGEPQDSMWMEVCVRCYGIERDGVTKCHKRPNEKF